MLTERIFSRHFLNKVRDILVSSVRIDLSIIYLTVPKYFASVRDR